MPSQPVSMLILGGTGFIGPHLIRYALARGHRVSVFNRGRTVLPDVEQLVGDREGNLDALKGRTWDAVIDIPARAPRWVRDAAQLLKDSVSQYVFISTISVYAESATVDADEDAPLLDDETYGGLKARAEKELRAVFGQRATIVRPGLIVGPGDPTDRFTYWVARVARGGEVLAPGNPSDPVQIIDVRDLAEWTVRLVEQKTFGTFNAVGPAAPLTMGEMLEGIRAATHSEARFTWVPAEFLERHEIWPWVDMPVWIPPTGSRTGFSRRSNRRALAAGLRFRPFAETVRATKGDEVLKAGITEEREAEVLEAWRMTVSARTSSDCS